MRRPDSPGGGVVDPSGEAPVLRVESVSKSFGGPRVLDSVTIEVGRNQVVGIVGENGAGKSTLFNILSGVLPPDSGRVLLHGALVKFASYHEATRHGISRVFQEQALIPNIPVYENMLLSHERKFTRAGQLLDLSAMAGTVQDLLHGAGIGIDVRRMTGTYDFSQRQLLEIARACLVPSAILGVEFPIVLLDEPTSSLQKDDEDVFLRMIAELRTRGSIVFVSHRLTEVLAISDVIYVLKDGKVVARVRPEDTTEAMLHGLMVGRERDADYYHEADQVDVAASAAVFSVQSATRGRQYADVSFAVQAGEVFGVGGLLESGKEALGRGIAGIVPPDQGHVTVGDSGPLRPEIGDLIRRGLGYVPAERLREGMIAEFSVAANITLASGGDLFSDRFGLWNRRKEVDVTARLIDRLHIKAAGPQAACRTLSGGNQQKVVLGRWLCRDLRVLVLDNPTRGVDAGAKEEMYALLRRLTEQGVAIVLITDELLELIGLSNRVGIMRNGRMTTVVDAPPHAKPTERELIALMLGGEAGFAGGSAATAGRRAEARR